VRSRRSLIIAGIGTFVVGILLLLPARVVVHFAAPPGVLLSGINGSAWSGSAREGSVNGAYFRDIEWRLKPLRIFTGVVAYSVKANPTPGFIETDLAVGFGGKIEISGLRASLPLERLSLAYDVHGTANLRFERVSIVDNYAVAADGTVEVVNLIVSEIGASSLGNFDIEFFSKNDGIAASIEDSNAVVDFAGSLELSSDRSFQFLGQIVEKPDTPADVLRQLQFLPPANARGQRELRLEGTL